MLDDLKKLLGSDGDVGQFATEMQQLTTKGRFDPFALFAGQSRLHSVFIAPFSPSLASARAQFLADGTGPLANLVENFQRQGLGPTEAAEAARTMFAAAQAMCVVVLSNDQGLDSVPQLFFGGLDETFVDHALKTCGDQFPHRDALRAQLEGLRDRAIDGAPWWRLHSGEDDDRTYWTSLAAELVLGLDGGVFGAAPERLRDLAFWIGNAGLACSEGGAAIEAEVLPAVLRCVALGGDPGTAFAHLAKHIGDLDDEDLVHCLHQIGDVAIARGEADRSVAWLDANIAALGKALGDAYDLQLVRFKALAASGAAADRLVAAAGELIAADKKSARHELTREPIWRVTAADPGEVVETAAAADLIGRSPAFVSKRLDQGTIPTVRDGDQVRLPRQALLAWKAVMDAHALLD